MRASPRAALTSAITLALALAACDDGPIALGDGGIMDGGAGDGATPATAYTVVVLPDTQYYASSWPEIFMAQTRWIADNRTAHQIAFVLHTGDLVDQDAPEQWTVAAQAMHALDGLVPYVITAGNHDYGGMVADRMGMGSIYFPPAQFASFPWFQGTFEADHIENSVSLVDVPGGQWLILALEFGPRDEVVAWANQILAAHPATPAILITHAYLYRDGTRYDHVGAPGQSFNPHDYVVMRGQPGSSINDGAELWTKLIEPNSNVKLVLSGHDVNGSGIPPGTAARLTSTRADGTIVQQLLANYQSCLGPPCETLNGQSVHGGNGFLRLLRFPASGHTVAVETYSPYLGQSLSDAVNQFTIDVP